MVEALDIVVLTRDILGLAVKGLSRHGDIQIQTVTILSITSKILRNPRVNCFHIKKLKILFLTGSFSL